MSCVSSIVLSAAVKFDYPTILRLPAFVAGLLLFTVFFFSSSLSSLSSLLSFSLFFFLSLFLSYFYFVSFIFNLGMI